MVRLRSPQVEHRGSRDSFTLVELLLVMLIVVMLTGAVIGSIGYVNRKAAEAKTQALLAKIGGALEAYNADWGEYPLARSNMWARSQAQTNYNIYLVTNLAGLGSGMRSYIEWALDETNMVVAGGVVQLYIVDAFGTPIAYDPNKSSTNLVTHGLVPTGRVNISSYDLWSYGADLQSGTVDTQRDDLKNWD
jgi:type II secretory pathway pseudopilin PulG